MATRTAKPQTPKVEEVTVDLNDLTWDDMDEIEAIAGRPIGTEMATGQVTMRTIRALAVWVKRKTDPTFELKGSDMVQSLKVEVRGNASRPTHRGGR